MTEEGGPMKIRTIQGPHIKEITRHGARAAVIAMMLLCAGCGGGGGEGSAPAAIGNVVPSSPQANSFKIATDDYGLENANYLAATYSSLGMVLRVAIASSMTDQNFKTVSRIDVPTTGVIAPAVVYSLGEATATTPAFPGSIYFFNGHPSTLLRTVGGTITFKAYGSNSGERISGSYNAVIEDGNVLPKARYNIAANFDFIAGSYGPVLPAPISEALSGTASYEANCASCHALGSYDTTAASAPDLALKGGRMNVIFSPELPNHQGVRLAAHEINALKVLLNVN